MRVFNFIPKRLGTLPRFWEYIISDNPRAAKRVREEILEIIQKLVRYPHQGHTRTDLTSRPLRFIGVRDYLIAYAPNEKPPWVSRSPHAMTAILRGRETR